MIYAKGDKKYINKVKQRCRAPNYSSVNYKSQKQLRDVERRGLGSSWDVEDKTMEQTE